MEKKLFGNICFTRLVKALMLSYFLTMLMLLDSLYEVGGCFLSSAFP